MFIAISKDGKAWQWASPELKEDHQFLSKAVLQDFWALEWASDGLKGDQKIVLQAFSKNGKALQCLINSPSGHTYVIFLRALQKLILPESGIRNSVGPC